MLVVSDDERREVARRLRSVAREVDRGGFSETIKHVKLAVFEDADRYRPDGTLDRLADLIEPTSDPTGRGIDSVYDWCWERLEGADEAEDELFCSIMRAIEDYRHPERVTAHTARPVDRDALLALADELDENAELIIRAARNSRLTGCGPTMKEAKHDAGEWRHVARRIREACGEVDG